LILQIDHVPLALRLGDLLAEQGGFLGLGHTNRFPGSGWRGADRLPELSGEVKEQEFPKLGIWPPPRAAGHRARPRPDLYFRAMLARPRARWAFAALLAAAPACGGGEEEPPPGESW